MRVLAETCPALCTTDQNNPDNVRIVKWSNAVVNTAGLVNGRSDAGTRHTSPTLCSGRGEQRLGRFAEWAETPGQEPVPCVCASR